MPRACIGGVDLHFQRFGRGPEIVLLHGLTANLAFWHPAVVSGLAEEFSITLLDFRGHGRSAIAPSGYTTRALAGDVVALLDHLGVERARLIGHSYGGAVALHAAVLAPDRVAGLVLADARVRALQPGSGLADWEEWPRVEARLAAHGIAIPPGALAEDLGVLLHLARLRVSGRLDGIDFGAVFVPFARGGRGAAQRWLDVVGATSAPAEFADVAGLTAGAIAAVSAPVLGVYGERSHCRPTLDALRALLPGMATAVVEGVGHFHPVLRPERFLDETRRFLGHPVEGAAARPPVAAARSGH